ncbi:hypothetical protein SUGI_0819370 [Cryptomeria japonica]|nr:hypothetical protein SUGI_0819370 [Cryptomeria japonica]
MLHSVIKLTVKTDKIQNLSIAICKRHIQGWRKNRLREKKGFRPCAWQQCRATQTQKKAKKARSLLKGFSPIL